MKTHWFVAACAIFGISAVCVAVLLPHSIETASNPKPEQEQEISRSLNLLFVGDLMFDRNVAVHAQVVGGAALFAGVKDLFAGHDLVIGNLEGTITTNDSVAAQDHSILRFTFAPQFADLLAQVGFGAVSLANNHSLDFGEFGYEDTIHFLQDAGVVAFGSPYNDAHQGVQLNIHDESVCLIGYHGLFKSDTTSTIEKITEARSRCNYVVVMAHWGVEYQHEPTTEQRTFAHDFIDAGADVVVGGHPHVVEPLEIYKNHAIFYSLGNFIFDQGFSPEVMRGLALEIDFTPSNTSFVLTPTTTYKEAALATGATADAVIEDVVTPYLAPEMAEAITSAHAFELKK